MAIIQSTTVEYHLWLIVTDLQRVFDIETEML